MTSDPTFWLLARASGLLAYALLTASVLAGLVLTARPFGRAVKPATVAEVHRTLAFLGLGTTALHGLALVLDDAVDIPLAALVVPGLVPYRPVWTALGVTAGLIATLLAGSWRLRRAIGTTAWRRIHKASYAAFALATLHGLLAGSDSDLPWALGLYLSAVGLVAGATAWRVMVPPPRSRGSSRASAERTGRAAAPPGTA